MDILGLYIPTWNRKNQLKQLLSNILPAFEKYGLPIYISDDNSTDGTETMVKDMQSTYKKLYYKKNDTGLEKGYAANLISVLRMGHTEFAWIFGDDDLIKDGALERILPELKNNDFLQINSEVWDSNFTKMLETRKIFVDHDTKYGKDEYNHVLLNARKGYAGFMGEIITRRAYLITELDKLAKPTLAYRDFLHTTLFFRAIVGKTGKLIAAPLIKNRMDGEMKGGEFRVWVSIFPQTLEELSPPYELDTVIKSGSLRLYSMIGITAMNKLQHPEKKPEYFNYLNHDRSINPINRAVITLILLSPNILNKVLISPILMAKNLKMKDSRLKPNDKQA